MGFQAAVILLEVVLVMGIVVVFYKVLKRTKGK